jgi:hypothetical protein
MAKRWSAEDIRDLKTFAQKHSVQAIAEKMDRTVGGVAFKAHQLGLRLKARSGGHRSGAHGFQLDRERRRRRQCACLRRAPLEQRQRPSGEVWSDAVSASLVGAVGIQRMGGKDAHADEGEDTC